MGLNGIAGFFASVGKKRNIQEEILRFTEAVADSKKVTRSRLSLSGDDLKLLPKQLRYMLQGIKNPTVHIGYQGGKGQATVGYAVSSGNKPVGRLAVTLDKTAGGLPRAQARVKLNIPGVAKDSKVAGGVFTINPSRTLNDNFIGNVSRKNGTYNIEFSMGDQAQKTGETFTSDYPISITGTINAERCAEFTRRTGLEMPDAKHIQMLPGNMLEESEGVLTEYKGLFTPKAKKVKAPKKVKTPKQTPNAEELAPKAPEASKTKEAAKPQEIKATAGLAIEEQSFLEEARQIMALGGKATKESADKSIQLILKKMGYDPNLIKIKYSSNAGVNGGSFDYVTGELKLNDRYLGQASHFDAMDVLIHELDHMDVAVKTAKAIGIDKYKALLRAKDGEFNAKFFEEAIKQADITGFNPEPFCEEMKKTTRMMDESFEYQILLNKYLYSVSPSEVRARAKERKFIQDLQSANIQFEHVLPLENYGKTWNAEYQPYYKLFEEKLAKYPEEVRGTVFNDYAKQAIKDFDEGISALLQKGSPNDSEVAKLNEFFSTHYDFETYRRPLYDKMLQLME